LLAAHPRRNESLLRKGVILVVDHDHTGAVGLQLNKPMESNTTLSSVMNNLGMDLKKDHPVYYGGPESPNRIIVVHTLDWSSTSTTKIVDNVGISNDISVLTAISANKGPKYFRAIAGYVRWAPTHLEGEIEMVPPWTEVQTSWSVVQGDEDLIFDVNGLDQWHYVIEAAAKYQISNWF
jgi:putative transcriptional regulator